MGGMSEKKRALYRLAGRDPAEYENHVSLDICTACGAKCVYCLHQAAGLARPRLMTKEVFLAMADILQREGFELVYLYQSGESFLHPAYPEFVASIAERGMNSSTATKLFMPIDFDELDAALDRCDPTGRTVEYLITVDAMTQEVQDRIAPGIHTETVRANLVEMAEMQQRHSCMKCVLDTVVNAHNENQLDEITAFIKDAGFESAYWYPKRMGYFMPRLADEDDLLTIAAAVPRSEAHAARFRVVDGRLVPYEEQHRCDLGPPAISPEGDVTVCCHDMLHQHRLGNVVEVGSLRRILASNRFGEAASKGRNMALGICQGCN